MVKYAPLHCHSHNSLLDGLSKPQQIVDRCQALGVSSCALTDHGNINGAVTFSTKMRAAGLKPILGCEFYVAEDGASNKDKNNLVGHQVILAKNINGWKKLIKLVSRSNDHENFYYNPRIDLEMLQEVNPDGDLVSFTGHPGSTLHLYSTGDRTDNFLLLMQDIFGKENFFLEIQTIYSKEIKSFNSEIPRLREIAQKLDIKTVATGDCHYASRTDCEDHRVLLCSSLKQTLPVIQNKLKTGGDVPLRGFFESDSFHIPSYDECIESGNTPEELENTNIIAEMCEDYNLSGKPMLPKYEWTEGMSEEEYLTHLCREGWRKKYKDTWNKEEYTTRIKKELEVFKNAGLAGYFLIVQDYVNYAKNNGILVGPGRGSGAGCLVSYLLGITGVDPMPFGLLFERFYNAGRNTDDRVSLPASDVDFTKFKRDEIIKYVQDRYGHDRVCQMATFGRLQGRGAIKEVLRIHNACPYETMNEITRNIPQEHEIMDHLEETGESSILRWTLQNEGKHLADWAQIQEDGTITGDYGRFFEQAIRLEGTYKSQGKHAAGIIISSEKLDDICPMIRDKNSEDKISGLDMYGAEDSGLVKFDILASAGLDKLQGVNNLLSYGSVEI